jgi:D-alanine-D-alanine ligase
MRLETDLALLRTTGDPREFGRVAVLAGGTSSEREVSQRSGAAVLTALAHRGVDAIGFDPAEQALAALAAQCDRVWIALHGAGGEDGTVQGALECLGLPYTGSGVAGAAVGMDKLLTKRLAQAIGVATPDYVVLHGPRDFDAAIEQLGLPLVVKPARHGSSIGMTKVERAVDLPNAFTAASALDASVFAERWIGGGEYTVAILRGTALPSIRIETSRVWHGHEAKRPSHDTRYLCPSGLSAPAERHLASLALAIFEATGAWGWGRVDFMVDVAGRPLVLEINTVPGMTDRSLVPLAARTAGIDFDELAWRVLETSLVRIPRRDL